MASLSCDVDIYVEGDTVNQAAIGQVTTTGTAALVFAGTAANYTLTQQP